MNDRHWWHAECECGCKMMFIRNYKTRRPRYMNDKHRDRAYRARARARAAAWRAVDEVYGGDMAQYAACYFHYWWREADHNYELHVADQVAAGKYEATLR
jgi:hypothetical protein